MWTEESVAMSAKKTDKKEKSRKEYKVLVALDFSASSARALRMAKSIMGQKPDRILVLHVIDLTQIKDGLLRNLIWIMYFCSSIVICVFSGGKSTSNTKQKPDRGYHQQYLKKFITIFKFLQYTGYGIVSNICTMRSLVSYIDCTSVIGYYVL